jgi:hypothetical protein
MFPGSDVCSWASFSLVFPRVTVPNTPRLSGMDINKNKINIKKCQRESVYNLKNGSFHVVFERWFKSNDK